jgi:serine/threonine-protein kinase
MGVVFAAVNEWIGREVALKLIHPEISSGPILARFFQEARVASQLDHPNIVTVFDLGRAEDGSWFIVQELLRGQSLEERLCRRPLFFKEAVELLAPIMSALVVAHDAKILHRDLKPANIFLHQQGEELLPKLIDFGISKMLFAQEGRGFETQGGWVGTPAYMAPEQIRAESDIGPAVDVFSMGAVFYRCLGGRLLFEGNPVAVAAATTTRDPVPLSELAPYLSAEVCSFVHTALARERRHRFADMRQMMQALLALPELQNSKWGAQLLARAEVSAQGSRQRAVELDLDRVAALRVGRTLVGRDDTSEILRPTNDTLKSVDIPKLAEFAPTQRSRRWRAWTVGLALSIGLLLVVLSLLVLLPSSPSPSTTQELVSNQEMAQTLCARWAPRLAREQQSDGAFTGITPLPATGWATAQLACSLASAQYACGAEVEQAALDSARAALSRFELSYGWGEFDDGWETPAAAWVVLWACQPSGPAQLLQPELSRAMDYLLAAQRADGGFADPLDPASDGYQSIFATLALLEGKRRAPERVNDLALRSALAWLRTELRAAIASPNSKQLQLREGAGLVAFASIPISLAADSSLLEVDDARLLSQSVELIAADCAWDGKVCARSVFDNDFVEVHAPNAYRLGRLSMVWAPWTWLAVSVLLEDARIDGSARSTLLALDGFFRAELLHLVQDDSALLGFTLAEWLFVASRLATPPPFASRAE